MRLALPLSFPALVVGLLLLASTAGAAESSESASHVAVERTPHGGIQPQAVVDDDGLLHLIYFKGDPAAGDLFYVRRRPGEQQFSAPIQVNSHPGSAIAVGTIRGAQLAVGKAGRVHVVWNGSSKAEPRVDGTEHDTPMLYTRLDETGEAFQPQRNLINHAFGLDGGGSVAADRQGNVYVAWHANPASDGEANRRVYLAVSTDDGASFAAEAPVSAVGSGVCACCGMKIWVAADGRLGMLYRTATDTVNRDVCLLSSGDGGQTFTSEILDHWHIATCPMSSATFAESPAGLWAGWETAGQVRFAQIDLPASGPRRPLRPGGLAAAQKHPAAAVDQRGETLLVWTEGTAWNRGGSVAWRRYDALGRPLAKEQKRDGVPVWGLPTVVAHRGGGFTIIY